MNRTIMKQPSTARTRRALVLAGALLAGTLTLTATPTAHAAGIVVNSDIDTVADDGVCTLREAITAANDDTASGGCDTGSGADTITFAGDYTITLGSQLPDVTSELIIAGNGATNTTIQADGGDDTATYRVLEVAATGNLTVDGVTIRNGNCLSACGPPNTGGNGGGILNSGGTLTVTNSTITDNTAGSNGGGIYNGRDTTGNGGTVTVTDSTLSGNSASGGNGGGIYNFGGTMVVTNSTLSGNSARFNGGGIFHNGTMTVTNSTLSGNTASDGGGVYSFGSTSTMAVTNSTISDNSAGSDGGGIRNGASLFVTGSLISGNGASDAGGEIYNAGTITANASNVFGHDGLIQADAFNGFTPGTNNFNATSDGGTPRALADILDTTLTDNGGPTQTHALVVVSPAIDFAGDCGLATDQRGVTRPQGADCDAGAFEQEVNQAPTAVAGGPYLVAVGASIDFDGSGSSDLDGDSLAETWTADGGTVDGNTYTPSDGPGIYDVALTVNDGTVDSEPDTTTVVVYDPSAGFVTGGGWIDSPAGAYTADPDLAGKATFGFVSKYKKGANAPDGNTQFQFKAGDLNFHSTSYDWLVVAGDTAKFKGEGTVNGQGGYTFQISADDDDPDTFRIQIWGDGGVVYDNDSQQALGGGSIKVHRKK